MLTLWEQVCSGATELGLAGFNGLLLQWASSGRV